MFEKMNESPNYSGESNLDESSLHAEIEERLKAFDENESIQNAPDLEKAKNNSALKGLLSSIVAGLGVALIASPLGTKILERFNNKAELENEALANMPNGVARSVSDLDINQPEGFDIAESLTGYEILDKLIDGSFEQYNNTGCFNYKSENKATPYSLSNPKAVLEALGINPEEATAEQRGIVHEYLAYSMAESAAPIAVGGEFEGFKGLKLEEATDKIKKMNTEQKAEFQKALHDWFSKTKYSYETGKGTGYIQYAEKDKYGNMKTGYEKVDLAGTKLLVSTTELDDGKVIVIYQKDVCDNPTQTIIVNNEEETIQSKNVLNMERIDADAMEDIAEDIGSEGVEVTQTSKDEVESQTPTENPATVYEPTIVQNSSSESSTTVQNTENSYSEDLGGANSNEYAPVEENYGAQAAADAAEIPVESAPVPGDESYDDILDDLGIN